MKSETKTKCPQCGTEYFEEQECDWCPGVQAEAVNAAEPSDPSDNIDDKPSELTCECCDGGSGAPSVGVASIPGVPMSIAWCEACLTQEAVPVWVAKYWIDDVGLDDLADWVKEQSVFFDGNYVKIKDAPTHLWKSS